MKLINAANMAIYASKLSYLPGQLLKNKVADIDKVQNRVSWEDEKEDILERAEWLCQNIVMGPEQFLKKMPPFLGKQYGGQWAIYSCVHLSVALANISVLYPEVTSLYLKYQEKIVDLVLSPKIRYYDTMQWKEDALLTLSGSKSHMTYLSLLACVISNYKFMGGSDKYDDVFHKCCNALHRRMLQRSDLCLPSFPNGIVFIPDMMFAIIALCHYSRLYDNEYADVVIQWLEKIKKDCIHKGTGLIIAKMYDKWNSRTVRGSYAALNCYCLTQIDVNFAEEQYLRMKSAMMKRERICNTEVYGIKEYLRKSPDFEFNIDAGPIVKGLSPSGTAWAIGSATYFGDWEFRNQLLRTAEIAGKTIKGNGVRHYKLSELALVGEAVVLAMRTHYSGSAH